MFMQARDKWAKRHRAGSLVPIPAHYSCSTIAHATGGVPKMVCWYYNRGREIEYYITS